MEFCGKFRQVTGQKINCSFSLWVTERNKGKTDSGKKPKCSAFDVDLILNSIKSM